MKKTNVLLRIIACAILLVAIGCTVGYLFVTSKYSGEPVRVEIPSGTDNDSISDILRSRLGASFGNRVANLWKLQGGTAQRSEGSYLIQPGTSAIRAARTIYNGRQTPIRLTFNNMRTIENLAARVGKIMEFDSASFIAACDTILPTKGYSHPEYAAAFLPDTYEFYWTDPADKVVDRLSDVTADFWNSDRQQKSKNLGLTPTQVSIIASIAEEESAKSEERGKIGQLYINRLRRSMPLQADPTVKFALGDFSLRRITGAHLSVESPYNTYKNQGLPPGPIRIPEKVTIDAVLDAEPHDYLYMCAKSDFSGYHDFAKDYNRHRINAARYHHALEARSIK